MTVGRVARRRAEMPNLDFGVAAAALIVCCHHPNRLVPLKGYPGIVWERPKSRRRPRELMMLSSAAGASRPRLRISSGERIRVPTIDPNTLVSSSRGQAGAK
jgi:hypothetical protein